MSADGEEDETGRSLLRGPYLPNPFPLRHLGSELPGGFLSFQEVRNPLVKPKDGRPFKSYGAWFQAHQDELQLKDDVLRTRETTFWPYGLGVTELSGSVNMMDNFHLGDRVIREQQPRQYAGLKPGFFGSSIVAQRGAADAGRSPSDAAYRWTCRRDRQAGQHSGAMGGLQSLGAGGDRSDAWARPISAPEGPKQPAGTQPLQETLRPATAAELLGASRSGGGLGRSGSAPTLVAGGRQLRLGTPFARESRLRTPLPQPQWNI